MKTVLVTGATGVLAKNFISRYSTEYKIIPGIRIQNQTETIKIDSWQEINTTIKIDAVVHFAGKYLINDSIESSKQVSDAVVGTATALVDFCKRNKTPIVALGSYFEKAPTDMQPWSHYTIAKQSAAKIFELASLKHDIPIRYIYGYDTYGNDLSRRKIVDVLLDPATENLELSPGKQKLNLTQERDFVEGVRISLEDLMTRGGNFESFQLRNISDEYTLVEVAEIINSLRKRKISLNFGAKPYRDKEVFDICYGWRLLTISPSNNSFSGKLVLSVITLTDSME
jgi:CDP-3, 6-dideoxy-D-glycero-L-glycero-4-hexulose-4-reductase